MVELSRALRNRKISAVEIRNESILETPRQELERKLPGKTIRHVGRRGKFIQIGLSSRLILWFHLGMTGQLLLKRMPAFPPHTHFLLSFQDFPGLLLYRDVRRFGRIALTPSREEEFPEGVRQLGPEPWDWEEQAFVSEMKARRARIKSLLLDQRFVSGLGNIYADESLYRAGIRPLKPAGRVPRARLSRLHRSMCQVLKEAIQWGGSSIDDYLHLDGQRGRFQEFHQVYGRTGERCEACASRIRAVKLSGRTSAYCPKCQQ